MRHRLGDLRVLSPLIVTVVAVMLASSGCAPSAPSGAASGGDRAPWCPETLPEAGTPCTPEPGAPGVAYTACEYGAEPHCSAVASCNVLGDRSSWFIEPPDPSCAGNPASCPASFADGGVAACTIGTSCLYATGRCSCAACGGEPPCSPNVCGTQDAGTGWGCLPWGDPGPGCPDTLLLGTPCTPTPNVVCGSNSGQSAICRNGYWSLGTGGC